MRILTVALILALALTASAQVRDFGLGLIIGEPTGLSAKWNFSPPSAIDFHLAWSILGGGIAAGADYLFHFGWLESPWRPYLGVGGRIAVFEENKGKFPEGGMYVSGRGLIGVEYLFLEGHLGASAELGLGLYLIPGMGFDVSGGLALRYYF
ncbi:MAG: hypothetical protein NTW26_06470 [bacterium]|nr:hypothetical protein [bacterium]